MFVHTVSGICNAYLCDDKIDHTQDFYEELIESDRASSTHENQTPPAMDLPIQSWSMVLQVKQAGESFLTI